MKKLLLLVLVLLLLPLSTQAKQEYKVYLPMVQKIDNRISGVALWPGQAIKLKNNIVELNPKWVRNDINWNEIESTKGIYNWNDSFTQDLVLLNSLGINTVATIQQTPEWARDGLYACSRIKEEHIPDFVEFVRQVILHYPILKYIE